MKFKYDFDFDFLTEIDGEEHPVKVTYYYAGTNFSINSASLEPNDPEEFEYVVLNHEGLEDDELTSLTRYERVLKDFHENRSDY